MREILFSKQASDKLEKLLEYLELEWSLKVKKTFIGKLDNAFAQISKFPDSASKSESVKGLHRFVISKQTTIYYKYDSKSVKIVTFFDNKMNPKRLKKDTE